ncbi:MAG TPA: L-lysine 6-transaminase [Vicinamibacteria bacterium]|nr:L-lysine 6-transaminase [Vicinamibacteria bacterium]
MHTSTVSFVSPAEVHASLARHILADGFDIVLDLDRSHGAWLHDARSGRELLDFCTFFASNPIGFNHPSMRDPEFQQVLQRAAQHKPALSDLYTVEYAWFVDVFGRLAKPSYLNHAFFIEGGALGVENAIKTAFDWKVRRNRARGLPGERGQQVLHFKEAFHGRSGYTLSLTNTDPVKTELFPKFSWPRVSNPKLRFPVTAEVEREVKAAEQQALDEVERAFAANPDDIAAVLVEPIQAEGGDNHFRPSFLQALEREAKEHDAFFIVDEVQTGVGITGRMWAHEHFGLRPDALAFGKKMQVGGCLVGPRVDEEPQNVFRVSSRINSTWGGNLTDMVRAARYLEIIEQDRLLENTRAVGLRLLEGLQSLQRELGGLLTNARGLGLMIAFDLPTPELRSRAQDAMLANGMLLLGCGPRSIRFRPPLNLTASEADAGLEIARRSLKEL